MSDKMDVYYFSPTGGTKKVSSIFVDAMEKEVIWHDLGSKETMMEKSEGEMIVVAAPVFGGRIPSVVREKIEKLSGTGKKAVTIAVYGNRTYEDALLEMNDIMMKCGFTVIASGAFIAQHFMAPKVKKNKGKGGIDGMQVDELLPFLRENQESLIQEIREGKYKPNPVRRVEIPKETKGEFRKLGVPTVVDRVIQQAIAQELSPIYEEQFSENSFGFRPKRGAHDALRQCQKNANEGYVYVVDMDLEKFFDTVCQSKLIEVLSQTIKDGRVISLIHKYLNAGVIANGVFECTKIGMPQGGPLSPLLSNVMLNELDKELEHRGHRFVRYADDCMIFCKSRKSAERTLKNIIPFIEGKLFLKVNRKKTEVAHISKVIYLGYTFYRYKGKCRFRVHPKSVAKMKDKIRELTDRSKGISNEIREKKYQEYVRGWVEYFRLADMKTLLVRTDEWSRHRIRAVYWKQWKKIKTRYRMLKVLGQEDWKARELANSRKGYWRMAQVLNQIFSKRIIAKLGYTSMLDYYLVVYEN